MKKLTVILASMVLLGTAAFAKNTSIGLTLSLPMEKVTSTLNYNGISASSSDQYSTIGIGIINVTGYTYVSADLSFLTKLVRTNTSGTVTYTSNDFKNTGISWMFANMLGGYAFKIVDTGTIQFMLAPGIHMYMFSLTYNDSYYGTERKLGLYLGAGADAVFKYYFSGSLSAVAGLGFAYDFWGIDSRDSNYATYMKYKNISFIPRIGIGFEY